MVRHKRGKYALGIHDFKHALSLEQSDTAAATTANVNAIQALLDKSMSKYEEVEGKLYSDNTNDNSDTTASGTTTNDTQVCVNILYTAVVVCNVSELVRW
jgi:transcription initiation factor IIF auxiliary subunit